MVWFGTFLPSSIWGVGVMNGVVEVLLLLSNPDLVAPYVAVQRSVSVQSSGEDESAFVPQARGRDLLWRTHITLKGTPRGCAQDAHTHK